jgi:hypothetical protein
MKGNLKSILTLLFLIAGLVTYSQEPAKQDVRDLFLKTLATIKNNDTTGFINLWQPDTIHTDPQDQDDFGLRYNFTQLSKSWKNHIDLIEIIDIKQVKNINSGPQKLSDADYLKYFGYGFEITMATKNKKGSKYGFVIRIKQYKGKTLYTYNEVIPIPVD